ncbi:MAG: tetratricopeptide repeat protein [Akkermansiaceae bacterium]
MDFGTGNLIEKLSERVLELVNAGNWDEAMSAADEAVEIARSSNDGELHDMIELAGALEIKADLLRQQNYFEDSRVIYLEASEMLNGKPECAEILARISASVGVLYDFAENDEEAILCYERAIEMYEQLGPNFVEEVADICNNLGFIYRSIGNMDTAETLFLKGLEICHEAYGKNHEKTAILFNNVGALYLKSGYDEQARNMHSLALEGRLASLGEDHPDTAQSYANLALSIAQMGERAKAKEFFLKALAIYERHIKTEPDEYAAVAANYAEFLSTEEGDNGSSEVIEKAQQALASA